MADAVRSGDVADPLVDLPLQFKHDLAYVLSSLQYRLGLDCLLEREGSIHNGSKLSPLDKCEQSFELSQAAHGRAQDRQALEEYRAQIERSEMMACGPTEYDASTPPENAQSALKGLPTDMIERDFHSFTSGEVASDPHEVLATVIDDIGSSQLPGPFQFRPTSGGSDDSASSEQRRDLDGGRRDARSSRVNQDILAGAQLCPRDQHMPRSEKYERDCGGLYEIEVSRQGKNVSPGHDDVLRITTIAMLSEYSVLRTERVLIVETAFAQTAGLCRRNQRRETRCQVVDSCTDLGHDARDLASRDDRKRKGIALDSVSHPEIEMIQGAGAHLYEDLSRTRFRTRPFAELEHLGTAVPGYSIGSHATILSPPAVRMSAALPILTRSARLGAHLKEQGSMREGI